MPHKDLEERAKWMREYRQKARDSGMCDACQVAPATIKKKCEKCDERCRGYRKSIKQQALDFYGGKCICCGEKESVFLCFDHIENNGNKMRRELPQTNGGVGLHYWLKRNGYPKDFQILCFNCNVAKHHNGGICPHQSLKGS